MRYLLLLFFFLFYSFASFAQFPRILSSEEASPIYLDRLHIDVKALGGKAITTFTMTFHNPSDRTLEGRFVFPLPEGAFISRYALDIEGRMREGVPVEKQKATQVFEAIERRQIDPGILEKTEGNNFRTRVYPVPAQGERTIIVGYEEELQLTNEGERRYHLPLEGTTVVSEMTITIGAQHKGRAPMVTHSPLQGLAFRRQEDSYQARANSKNDQLKGALSFLLPKGESDTEVYAQTMGGQTYFYLHTQTPESEKEKPLPHTLAIVWDNSLSGLYRDKQRELLTLQQYLAHLGAVRVILYSLRNTFRQEGTYEARDGRAPALLKRIEELSYDGGTDYSKIRLPAVDEVLFFTDGVSTLSEIDSLKTACPVYTITSSKKANYGMLKRMAEGSGGAFINLTALNEQDAGQKLLRQPFSFLGIRGGTKDFSFYPSGSMPVGRTLTLGGMYRGGPLTLRLQFGYGRKVTLEKEVHLSSKSIVPTTMWDLSRLVAQLQVAALEQNEEKNREPILRLAREHTLVTSFTSLMVLERIEDYVQHEIQPPPELLQEYNRLLERKRSEITELRQENKDDAFTYSKELWKWWNTYYPAITKPVSTFTRPEVARDRGAATINERTITMRAPVIKRDEEVIDIASGFAEETVRRSITSSVTVQSFSEVVVMGAAKGITIRGAATSAGTGGELLVVDGEIVTEISSPENIQKIEALSAREGTTLYGARAVNGVLVITTKGAAAEQDESRQESKPVIMLKERASGAEYLQVMRKTPKGERYQTYLRLRENRLFDPTFYVDMAAFFLPQDKATGLQILTNLAELDFQNHELFKLFGFKLRELGQGDLAAFIFRTILHWRPHEPQSYRDYALALLDNGKYQSALDTLYRALAYDYSEDIRDDYDGIEEVLITELSHMAHRYGDKVSLKGIPKELLRPMPIDVRVVLNWNMDDIDIDLWVTDPRGEKCYYKNNETTIGGRLSDDFTNGYGPEQFLLKRAVKGTYKLQVHYYGDNGAKLAGRTTLLVEIYTNYGRASEERRLLTLQLKEEEKEGVYVGEFTF